MQILVGLWLVVAGSYKVVANVDCSVFCSLDCWGMLLEEALLWNSLLRNDCLSLFSVMPFSLCSPHPTFNNKHRPGMLIGDLFFLSFLKLSRAVMLAEPIVYCPGSDSIWYHKRRTTFKGSFVEKVSTSWSRVLNGSEASNNKG